MPPLIPGVGPDAPIETTSNGAKQSATPYRMDLLPPQTLLKVAEILAGGAIKYGEQNWRGLSVETNLNHALVHIYAYLAGDRQDDHLNHAACRMLFAAELARGTGNTSTTVGPCHFCHVGFKPGEAIYQMRGKNYHKLCQPLLEDDHS